MPIRVLLTPDGLGVVYKSSGLLTGQDLLDADELLGDHVAENPQFRYLLIDHSEVPEQDVDTASLRVLAERAGTKLDALPEALVAIIAPNDVLFGLSRMWAGLAHQPGLKTLVTRDRDAALSWLETELAGRGLKLRLV